MPERPDLQALCEAILAAAGEPVAADTVRQVAGDDVDLAEVEEALERVRARHEQESSGLLVERVAGGWRLATRPQHEAAVRAFLGVRARTRLSAAALETLAIVAYRQPITLPEINYLRGVNCSTVLRTLAERGLVRAAGRKHVVGTPLLYRTTREFLVHFGLDSLSALPAPTEGEQPAGVVEGGS